MQRGMNGHGRRNRGLDTSFEDFSKVIQLSPNNPSAYAERAFNWDAQGDIDNAINDFTTAIKLGERDADTYFRRGNYRRLSGDFDGAVEDYNKALQLDEVEGYYDIDVDYGIAWFRATCPDARYRDGKIAVKYATKVCEHLRWKKAWIPSILDLHGTLAAAYAETGDFANAVKWGESSLKSAPADKRKQATERLQLYRAKKPYRDSSVYSEIGWRRATSPVDRYRDGKMAVEYAEKACELDNWNDWKNLRTLAAAYAESGDFLNAVKWQEKAIELAPEKEKQGEIERLELLSCYSKPYRQSPEELATVISRNSPPTQTHIPSPPILKSAFQNFF